ncbi:MAG: peptidase S41 [Acidobacteria bacterium]|nr:MAG: peptidase S41 [Acidobacteriota bacterium]
MSITKLLHQSLILWLSVLAFAGLYGQEAKSQYKENLSDSEKIYGLAEFWKEASYNFAYFDHVPQLDWNAAFTEYVPKVLQTKSTKEYYRVLMTFSALLKDGHTNIYPPQEVTGVEHYDKAPVAAKAMGHRAIIVNVDKRFSDQVPLGSEITAVDGIATEEYLKAKVIPYISSSAEHALWEAAMVGHSPWGLGLAAGEPGSEVRFTIRTPDGQEQSVRMVRDADKRAAAGQLEMAAPDSAPWNRPMIEHRWLEEGIFYVALNSFNDSKIVDRFKQEVVPELPRAKGVVIDIRVNGGGSTGNGTAILDYFVNEPLKGSAWRTREHVAAYKAWATFGSNDEKHVRHLKGNAWHTGEYHEFKPTDTVKFLVPVVVLISVYTGSAAEDFLIFIDGLDRFTTVGEPTVGSTGQPLQFELPGGGRGRICTKRDTYPDGRDFVGYGVKPEIPVERTPASLVGKDDPVLKKGVEVLKEKMIRRAASE